MPRHDRLPHARRQRRLPGRVLLLSGAAGLAILLAVPVIATLEGPVTLTGTTGHAVSGQEPTPGGSPAPATSPVALAASASAPAWSVAPTTPPQASTASPAFVSAGPAAPGVPASSTSPVPAAPTLAPVIAVRTSHGVPPERTWAEWTGTHARPLDMLTGYRWPLAHPRLTLPFGPTFWGSRLVDGQPFHDGVDLATFCNDRVLAAHAGTVIAAGRHYDDVMGWVGSLKRYYSRLDHNHLWFQLPIVVVIDDGNGYRSMYAHMWRITVKKGDHVKAGQLIGNEGRTGRASGCHLHYGLFSPWETDTFRLKPDVAKRMQLPKAEIARVDPLKVLPKRAGINAPKHPKASATPTQAPEP